MREIGISPRFSRDKFVPLQTKQRYSTRDISGEVFLTLFFRGFVPFLSLADFVSRDKNLQVVDLQRLKSCFGELVTTTTRMVFNVLANNTDDHNKNFSFVMSEDGTWRLSPAYDVTYIFDNGGFLPNEDHCMYIRAKLRDITRDDVIQFAKDNGIRRPDAIIRDIVNAIKQFRVVATKYGVAEQWIGRVENTMVDHLKSWGELEEMAPEICEFVINGHIIKNIRMEQAYKENYHLLIEIDGHERKFIIGKNREEFSLIESMGIANLSSERLKDMVEKYFIL